MVALPQILQRASFKLGNPPNTVNGGMGSMVVMLSVTVELMSAMQRRCWKTGFKMEGDVSYFLLYLETRKSIKDHKACDEELTTYLSVDKSRVKFKMHSASENSEIEYLKNLKRKIWAKTSSSIVKIKPNNGFDLTDL